MGPAMAGSGWPLESAVELTYTTPGYGPKTAISGTTEDGLEVSRESKTVS